MKTALVTASIFAAVACALLALVLAGFGVIPAFVAFAAFGASACAFAYLAGSEVEIRFVETIEIVEAPDFRALRAPRFSDALVTVAAFVAPALSFAALVLAGLGCAL